MQAKANTNKKAHEIKNPAFAFGVYGNNSKRIAEVAVTNKGLIWSKSNSKASKDVTVKWDDFINWMEAQLPASPKTKAPAKAKAASASKKAANGKATKTAKARTAKSNGVKRAAPAKKAAAKTASASAASK